MRWIAVAGRGAPVRGSMFISKVILCELMRGL